MATAPPVPPGLQASASLIDDLQAAVRATRRFFAAAACSCALVTDAGDALVFVAADGEGAAAIVGVSIPVSKGVAGWAAMTGQPIAVRDVQTDARFAREVAESTRYVPDRILAVPLMTPDGEVSGVMEVLDPTAGDDESAVGDHRRTSGDLDVLALVASQVAAVVRSARALTTLEDSTAATGELGGRGAPELLTAVRAVAGAGPEGVRLATRVLTAVDDYLRDQNRTASRTSP
jgi:GAF domain-containing protein